MDFLKLIKFIESNKNIAEMLFYFSSWINSPKDISLFITDE